MASRAKNRLIDLYQFATLSAWRRERRAKVFLISFPKCGRTWLRLMLGKALINHFGLSGANALEPATLARLHPAIPAMLVTHDGKPLRKRPEQLGRSKAKYRTKKVILLVRDPRDVVISAFFQRKKRRDAYAGTLQAFLTEPVGSLDTFLRFYNIWADNRAVPKDLMLVRYEDLHTDAALQLRRVLEFIGVTDVLEAHIQEAVSFAAFDNMRRMEEEDRFQSERLQPKRKHDIESYKTRRGKVGGYVDYLEPGQIEYLNHRLCELSDFYGYAA